MLKLDVEDVGDGDGGPVEDVGDGDEDGVVAPDVLFQPAA